MSTGKKYAISLFDKGVKLKRHYMALDIKADPTEYVPQYFDTWEELLEHLHDNPMHVVFNLKKAKTMQMYKVFDVLCV